jgi:site-specific DNA-methyltransferase (adenine-specific)
MRPYYEDAAVKIYHGDARELMLELPADDYVTIADPPYEETKLKWDKWQDGWPSIVAHVSKTMWCFGSFRMFMANIGEFDQWTFSQDVIWEKHNGSGAHADRFRRIHETAVFFYRKGCAWSGLYHTVPLTMDGTKKRVKRRTQPPNWSTIGTGTFISEEGGPRQVGSVIYCRSCHGHAIHDTQKPEGIVRPLMEYASPPGGVILSPFMGSGTDLRVAKDSGRRAIGIDSNEENCEKAANRMSQSSLAIA